jgi:hypothetical protein
MNALIAPLNSNNPKKNPFIPIFKLFYLNFKFTISPKKKRKFAFFRSHFSNKYFEKDFSQNFLKGKDFKKIKRSNNSLFEMFFNLEYLFSIWKKKTLIKNYFWWYFKTRNYRYKAPASIIFSPFWRRDFIWKNFVKKVF